MSSRGSIRHLDARTRKTGPRKGTLNPAPRFGQRPLAGNFGVSVLSQPSTPVAASLYTR